MQGRWVANEKELFALGGGLSLREERYRIAWRTLIHGL